MVTALYYASELIEFNSVSPLSNVPVTERISDWMIGLGMEIERVDYTDRSGVSKANIIGKLGAGVGGMAYFCHTDVVPANDWAILDHGPFTPRVSDGKLYGRGSCDMKGSLACMLAAVKRIASKPLTAPVYVCCTADEEVGMLGAEHVVAQSQLYREMTEHDTKGIVGEPTKFEVIYGHKGGCGLRITAHGKAAHSSTNRGLNANWQMIPFLQEVRELYHELETDSRWHNPEFSPATTSLNLCISDSNPAGNVTAAQSVCIIYFRTMPNVETPIILNRLLDAIQRHGLEWEFTSRSNPFYRDSTSDFVQECLQFSPVKTAKTVSYGTDAARFQDLKNCVVMGPGDIAQAHTVNEFITLSDLEQGTNMYHSMIERWCQ